MNKINKIIAKNNAWKLIVLCWIVYFTSYLGRLNYAACKIKLIEVFGASNAQVGLVSTFFFVTYGAGQLISGFLADRFNPKYTVTFALLLSALINLTMPFMPSLAAMKYLWALNGAVQSLLWTNIISTFALMLPQRSISGGVVALSTSYAAGTLVIYGVVALCIKMFSWKIAFYFSFIMLLFVALIWFFAMTKLQFVSKNETKNELNCGDNFANKRLKLNLKLFVPVLIFILLLAIINGFIRDGLTEWTPNIVNSVFGLEESMSVLITLVLPLFGIAGGFVGAFIYRKLKNPMTCVFVLNLLTATVFALSLTIFEVAVAITIVLFGIIMCLVIGINNMLVSVIPLNLRIYGRSGTMTGIINTFCYVGSGASPFVLGMIADGKGWNAAVVAMAALAAVGIITSLIGSILWRRFTDKKSRKLSDYSVDN